MRPALERERLSHCDNQRRVQRRNSLGSALAYSGKAFRPCTSRSRRSATTATTARLKPACRVASPSSHHR